MENQNKETNVEVELNEQGTDLKESNNYVLNQPAPVNDDSKGSYGYYGQPEPRERCCYGCIEGLLCCTLCLSCINNCLFCLQFC